MLNVLRHKIHVISHTCRETFSQENHPINVTSKLIETAIRNGLHQDVSNDDVLKYPYVIDKHSQTIDMNYLLHLAKPCTIAKTSGKMSNETYCDPSHHKYFNPCENSSQTIRCQVCVTSTSEACGGDICAMYSRNETWDNDTVNFLRSNLLESIVQTGCFMHHGDKCVRLAKGDTYQRCTISPTNTPQQYEMVFWQRDCEVKHFIDVVKSSLESTLLKQNISHEAIYKTDITDKDCTQYEKVIFSYINVECILSTHVKTENPLNVPCNMALDHIRNNTQLEASSCENIKTQDGESNQKTRETAKKIPYAYIGSLKTDTSVQLCVCIVDVLCRALYNVNDARLLWSNCPEFLSQLSKIEPCVPVQPLSLYAPEWKHDVSFWLDPEVKFDELTYMDVVRDHLGDCVTEVKLMNVWTPQGEKRTSRCYRQLHQPCDQAVSYHRAHEFQRLLRLKVAHVFKVELR